MYKNLLLLAVGALLPLAACGNDESSPAVNTGKASEAENRANVDSRGKEIVVFGSDVFSFTCRMNNGDSATVTRKLMVDYNGYEKLAAYTETAEYDEFSSFEDLTDACETAMKTKNAEVVCEDNVIVTTYVVENTERTDVKKVMKEKCREWGSED